MSRLPRIRTVAKRLRRRYFPERQLYFRANGVVRFISVSSRVQIAGSAAALMFITWVAVTSFNFLARDEILEAKERQIETMARAYETLDAEMKRLQSDVKATADKLRARQEYLRQLVGDDNNDTPEAAEPDAQGGPESDAAAKPVRPMAFLFDAFGGGNNDNTASTTMTAIEEDLVALAARQRVIAGRLLKLTHLEIDGADRIFRETGLNKDKVLAVADTATQSLGQGGPFVDWGEDLLLKADSSSDAAVEASADPFVALYQSQNELAMLENALASMPVAKPVKNYYISSGFGRRLDPMRKSRAMHYGVDMAGWWNTPVMASAVGVVTFAGRNGAYGNFVEINHGNGFRSRYGHLKRTKVKKGQRVERGQVVGLMGSTGRSTGPHLHYEVWFSDTPLNPVKFFKAEDDVFKIQQHHPAGTS